MSKLQIAMVSKNSHCVIASGDTIDLMREVFLKRPRMFHLFNIDDYVASRVFLWYVRIGGLKMKKMSALCQFLSRVTAESEVSLDILSNIIVRNIREITLTQS